MAGATGEGSDGTGGGGSGGREPQVARTTSLVPVAGILDVLDNYAFVRTSGYLAGPNDVYVSMSQVRKNGLRRGDAVTGAVRAPQRDGEQRQRRSSTRWSGSTRSTAWTREEAKQPARVHQADPAVPAASGCAWRPSRTC